MKVGSTKVRNYLRHLYWHGQRNPIEGDRCNEPFVVPRHRDWQQLMPPPDGFRGRLTKYVPAEILALYTTAVGGLITAKPTAAIAPWITVGLSFFSCSVQSYILAQGSARCSSKGPPCCLAIRLSRFAYPVAASLFGAWFIGWIAIFVQALAALLAWLIDPEEKPAGNH